MHDARSGGDRVSAHDGVVNTTGLEHRLAQGVLPPLTVTLAVPLTPPLAAVTV